MEPRRLRTFSLFESQRKRGGKSKFRDFLTNLGHVMRPYLNRLATVGASALTDKVTQAMGRSVGKNALELGSRIIQDVAKGKTDKLLNHIKGAGFTGLPDDISEKLSVENKKSLASLVGSKKKRKTTTKKKKRKTKKKVGGKAKTLKKRKKAGSRKAKKGGHKGKKAGRKTKKAGRKTVTKIKRKTVTSIFD